MIQKQLNISISTGGNGLYYYENHKKYPHLFVGMGTMLRAARYGLFNKPLKGGGWIW